MEELEASEKNLLLRKRGVWYLHSVENELILSYKSNCIQSTSASSYAGVAFSQRGSFISRAQSIKKFYLNLCPIKSVREESIKVKKYQIYF